MCLYLSTYLSISIYLLITCSMGLNSRPPACTMFPTDVSPERLFLDNSSFLCTICPWTMCPDPDYCRCTDRGGLRMAAPLWWCARSPPYCDATLILTRLRLDLTTQCAPILSSRRVIFRVGKNPGFLKKIQPSGFFVFFLIFWVFWVFLGFFAQTRGFLGFF
jgi:hypothetical protein